MTSCCEWEESAHRIKYIFGEYCFFSTTFRALELTTHPTRLTEPLEVTISHAQPLLNQHRVLALPAYPISRAPKRVIIARDYIRYVPARTTYHFTELGPSYDVFMKQLEHKHRHDLRRKLRRFAAESDSRIDVRVYRTAAEAAAFYPLASDISQRTYQHRLLSAGLPQTGSFEAEMCERANAGTMRGYLLYIRDRPIAYAYATTAGDFLRFRHIGYERDFARLSPGIVLIHEALRSAIDEKRFVLVDFGAGEAQYKRSLATGSLECATVFVFRDKVGPLAMALTHQACVGFSDACVSVLDRAGVKERVKNYLRNRATSASN